MVIVQWAAKRSKRVNMAVEKEGSEPELSLAYVACFSMTQWIHFIVIQCGIHCKIFLHTWGFCGPWSLHLHLVVMATLFLHNVSSGNGIGTFIPHIPSVSNVASRHNFMYTRIAGHHFGFFQSPKSRYRVAHVWLDLTLNCAYISGIFGAMWWRHWQSKVLQRRR